MEVVNRYGFYFLIVAVFSELALPFVLGHFVSGYSQTEMLISSFGETGMRTKAAFRLWEILNGCLFILAAPAFYHRFTATNPKLALCLGIFIVAFGIGDCIITGLVSRAKTTEEVGFASLLHNYASGAGFVALLLGTLVLMWLYYQEKNQGMVMSMVFIFLLASLFMLLFAMPKLPIIKAFQVSHRGLWQRLNLLFLYLPYVLVSLETLQKGRG